MDCCTLCPQSSLKKCLTVSITALLGLVKGRKESLKTDVTKERENRELSPDVPVNHRCHAPCWRPRGKAHLSAHSGSTALPFPARASGWRTRLIPCRTAPPPPRFGQLSGSLTSDGFRREASFLQAPLAPSAQSSLLLHLRGRVLCRHQRLSAWGQRTRPLGVFFLNDHHPDVLGVRSAADSTCQGRTQGSCG